MAAFTIFLGNLIKSYKRLPSCGSSYRISHTYRFSFEHGNNFSNSSSFFNQKRKLFHLTKEFINPPSKTHFIPSTRKTTSNCKMIYGDNFNPLIIRCHKEGQFTILNKTISSQLQKFFSNHEDFLTKVNLKIDSILNKFQFTFNPQIYAIISKDMIGNKTNILFNRLGDNLKTYLNQLIQNIKQEQHFHVMFTLSNPYFLNKILSVPHVIPYVVNDLDKEKSEEVLKKHTLSQHENSIHEESEDVLVSKLHDDPKSEIKIISDHLNKHAKPPSDEAFGYYLAGLIEANGYIDNDKLVINLSKKDVSLAYYIKKRVGYGRVVGEDPVKYLLEHPKGLKKTLTLLNGKFLTTNITDQLLNNKCDQKYEISISPPTDFNIAQNHFLAGFCDLASYFSIITSDDMSDNKVKLRFSIRTDLPRQKDPTIFQKVQSKFGGSIYLNNKTGIYHYEASSFQTNSKTIDYFDQFHLNSSRYVDYFKWRKAYRVIQRGEHHSIRGLEKITGLKESMVHKHKMS
ncbi:hypothetical protein RclHR1_02260009 [Rhizophagus clarus]|uniref:LAGLIDADG endonuclease n=1 Tax=Rhizophagus clarus TaxID=94130 RepID=A0A2Z6R838_9GLOM|nr:hypothetical protein RclHR1_02260009 [Rhizophagus clarus]GES90735.1 LAGLIDADG endonuclease [Rhizophagus clarus]